MLSALEMLDKSIEADPNNAQAYAWRACSLGRVYNHRSQMQMQAMSIMAMKFRSSFS